MNRILSLLIACAGLIVLGGCATGHDDREHFMAPTGLSDLYSRASMEFNLAITPHERESCAEAECVKRAEFDHRVARIGAKIAEAAHRSYPGLAERIPRFDFVVVDKTEAGTASAAGGYIVILRPVGSIALSDEALSFVIAREIGHVVSQHHERNTATSLAISVLAMAVAPVLNVAKLLALLYSGSTSAVAASSVTSAASYASSRAIIESYWPQQRQEADEIAKRLITLAGYDTQVVAAGFAQECPQSPPTRWVRELHESVTALSVPALPADPAAPAGQGETPKSEQALAPVLPASSVE